MATKLSPIPAPSPFNKSMSNLTLLAMNSFKSFSVNLNSIVLALSNTFGLNIYVVSSIFTVPMMNKFFGRFICFGIPFSSSSMVCKGIASPDSIVLKKSAK